MEWLTTFGGAVGGKLCGREDGLEVAASEHVGEEVFHRGVDEAVGGKDFAAVEGELAAVEVGDAAASFFDQEIASRGVPRIELELPVAVETAARYVGEVEGGRAGAANAVRAQRELLVEVDVGALVTLVAGKAGGDERLVERVDAGGRGWARR